MRHRRRRLPAARADQIAKKDFPSGVGDGVDGLTLTWNGGITGIVSFDTTRAENDPRWGTMELWQPGVPYVKMELWDATRTHQAERDDHRPLGRGVARPGARRRKGDASKYVFLGKQLDCFDGLRNFEQVRPGVYDGAFAFFTVVGGQPDRRADLHEGLQATVSTAVRCRPASTSSR